jgi:GNAT superfamily N-acetyltransferase
MEKIQLKQDFLQIRFARREDTAIVLKFIKDLAVFENELDQVTATEDVLEKSLFDRNGAEVILGEYKGDIVGFALFHNSFSTFQGKPGIHLVDLFIVPEMRGNGFGKKMLAYLAKLTLERDCGRLEWWVHEWNQAAIEFYKGIDAYPIDNLRIWRLCDNALSKFSQ